MAPKSPTEMEEMLLCPSEMFPGERKAFLLWDSTLRVPLAGPHCSFLGSVLSRLFFFGYGSPRYLAPLGTCPTFSPTPLPLKLRASKVPKKGTEAAYMITWVGKQTGVALQG